MPESEDMQRFDALLKAMVTKPEAVVPCEPDACDLPEDDER